MVNTRSRIPIKIGHYIKKARLEKNIRQSELADKAGISRAQLAQWESELRNPTVENFNRIAPILGIDLDDIIEKDTSTFKSRVISNSASPLVDKEKSLMREKMIDQIADILDNLSNIGLEKALDCLISINLEGGENIYSPEG